MVFNVLDAASSHTQAILWLDLQESFKDIPSIALEHAWNHWLLHCNVLVHLHFIFIVVGRKADEHLIQEDT